MKKKAFTLIEVVITIVVIGIVLSMVARLGRGFSERIRFASTKETFVSAIHNAVQEAATSDAIRIDTGTVSYGSLTIEIASGNTIMVTYDSGELTTPFSRQIVMDGGVISTSGFTLTLVPYGIGCDTASGASASLTSTADSTLSACYTVQHDTCKLQEITCHF